MKLANKVALIDGSTSGIGRAGAELFAREGAKVVVTGRNDKAGEQVVQGIARAGGDAYYVRADLQKVTDIENLVDKAIQHYGRIDIYWHNAGAPGPMGIENVSEEKYEATMNTHVKGGFFGVKYVLPQFKRQGRGVILFTSSLAGLRPASTSATYSCAKSALIHLSNWLAFNYAKDNIRVNCICPGNTETPIWDIVKNEAAKAGVAFEQYTKSLFAAIPMGRLGQPSEIASAALYLVSDDASYITGAVLNIDGGSTVYSRPL